MFMMASFLVNVFLELKLVESRRGVATATCHGITRHMLEFIHNINDRAETNCSACDLIAKFTSVIHKSSHYHHYIIIMST